MFHAFVRLGSLRYDARVLPSVSVPLLDLHLQYASIRDRIDDAVRRVCESQQFILGPEVTSFESEIASFIGAGHGVGVSSGTDALLVSLMALGVGPGDEVITPTFSFFATAGCVHRLGAQPVFVDVGARTLLVEPEAVRAAVTPRTKAIIPVHLYGLCADVDAIAAALPRPIPILEDAAQAIGATIGRRSAGTLGLAACFSFFPSKNLGAFGDAGLVTTNDAAFASKVRLLRMHGETTRYHHADVGGNFRIDALQAAVLRAKLPFLNEWNRRRQENARRYDDLFRARGLDRIITLPPHVPERTHIYHQYVIRVADRDRVKAHLTERNIGTAIYYPVPFHRQACFSSVPSASGRFPNADAACREVLALPIYPELTIEQQEHVVRSLAEVCG